MVDVPVDDRDPFDSELGLGESRGDGNRVEEAEAHRLSAFRVMAWRSGKRETVSPNRLDCSACREQRRLEGRLGADRVRVDPAACRPHQLDQLRRMASQHVTFNRRLALDECEALVQRDDADPGTPGAARSGASSRRTDG